MIHDKHEQSAGTTRGGGRASQGLGKADDRTIRSENSRRQPPRQELARSHLYPGTPQAASQAAAKRPAGKSRRTGPRPIW